MRILYIADGRSPTALNWICSFIELGDEVHLVSTFPADSDLKIASFQVLPMAMNTAVGDRVGKPTAMSNLIKRVTTAGMRTRVRQWLGGATLDRGAQALAKIVDEIQPDLVHALRIPFEGMLAARARLNAPLLVSIWGNDFTLHAPATAQLGWLTRETLTAADGLLADCQRDLRLAGEWGFSPAKPQAVYPGGGGIRSEIFHPSMKSVTDPVVINPRGLRAYVRNDTFFKAIPLVLAQVPEARFVCPTMAGQAEAERWVSELGLSAAITLLPLQSPAEMAALYRGARVAVSPSEHDGTPNTLLEAMACGCLPVAGDIESLREWITHGENGLLVDPGDPSALAESIIHGLTDDVLQAKARAANDQIVKQRADHARVMPQAREFCLGLVNHL